MFNVRGRLIYDPVRPGFRKSHKTRTLIVSLPRDQLDLYYQWFLRQQYGTWFDHRVRTQEIFVRDRATNLTCWGPIQQIDQNVPLIDRPMYGLHVTVVKGNEHIPSANLHLWKKYEGQEIEICYDPTIIKQTWQFWSIHVESPRLLKIRQELGLNPNHRFHITIGRTS